MARKTVLLLALCLLGSALVDRAHAREPPTAKVGKADPSSGGEPTPLKASDTSKAINLADGAKPGMSSKGYYYITTKITCWCSRGCRFTYVFYTGPRPTRYSGTKSLPYGYYFSFDQRSDYYYRINGYQLDPELTSNRRFC